MLFKNEKSFIFECDPSLTATAILEFFTLILLILIFDLSPTDIALSKMFSKSELFIENVEPEKSNPSPAMLDTNTFSISYPRY